MRQNRGSWRWSRNPFRRPWHVFILYRRLHSPKRIGHLYLLCANVQREHFKNTLYTVFYKLRLHGRLQWKRFSRNSRFSRLVVWIRMYQQLHHWSKCWRRHPCERHLDIPIFLWWSLSLAFSAFHESRYVKRKILTTFSGREDSKYEEDLCVILLCDELRYLTSKY